VIPTSRINPIAAKVTSFYPAPNLAGDGPGHQNNYQKILPATNTYDSWLGKMDYMFSQKSRVSVFIAEQVKRWDLAQLTRLIEINIGRDLQYIRFNGMLIGGLAGVVLHIAERLFLAG